MIGQRRAAPRFLPAREFGALDGLRAWAVLMVFDVHFFDAYWRADYGLDGGAQSLFRGVWATIHSGHVGVDLFFVLSGFIIHQTLRRKPMALLPFLRRRYARLLPAHVAVLLPILIAYLGSPDARITTALANLFLVQELLHRSKSLNFVTWSLSYEVLWYALAATWMAGARRKGLRWLGGGWFYLLVVFLVAAGQLAGLSGAHALGVALPNLARFLGFVLGFGLSRLHGDRGAWMQMERWFSLAWAPSLAVVFAMRFLWTREPEAARATPNFELLYYGATDLAFTFLVAAALCGDNPWKRFFERRPLQALGRVSYSFYLVHALYGIPLGAALATRLVAALHLDTPAHLQAQMFIAWTFGLVSTTLIALLLFAYFEQPYFARAQARAAGA